MNSARSTCFFVAGAILLTALFWGPLWCGYGFVGGDLYPYFFPQKTFLADRLHAGEFPLWNNLTGFGYPILGESQTGVAYPPHIIAYYFFDANTAYNIEHLAHYMLCFVGTCLFATRIGLRLPGAVLTSVVFTYGWFPPRACLEWAIVTGAWLPVCLWCVESFVQTRWWRFPIGLSLALGLQLLAGHFHLAFITQLIVVAYGTWRIRATTEQTPSLVHGKAEQTSLAKSGLWNITWKSLPIVLTLGAAIIAGFLLASVQLLPAWEMKTRSSRAVVGEDHDPSYGHLPPLYASQLVAPWLWYSPMAIDEDGLVRAVSEFGAPWHWFGPHKDLDELLMQSRTGGLTGTATNKVEAHLYCGLAPLLLAVWWVFLVLKQRTLRGEALFWGTCGILAVVYATGWLLPIARHIPGFNFFRGPGRYGIVTTLAVAIFAGRGLQSLLDRWQSAGRFVLVTCVFGSTICDLWLVSRMVTYAVMVSRPPISFREESPIRKLLLEERTAPRLYAPGQNLGNLFGVSCIPVYLGIAPREYSDSRFAGKGMPKPTDEGRPVPADEEFSKWLIDCGVTHILAFHRLEESSWHADLVWQGMDPMMSRAWARWSEPLYLYQLRDALGRATALVGEVNSVDVTATAASQRAANSEIVEFQGSHSATVIVRDLDYPGWQVTIDGQPAATSSHSPYRGVEVPEGKHQIFWTYRPVSFKVGLTLSLLTLFVLAAIGHVRFWHPTRLERMFPALRISE